MLRAYREDGTEVLPGDVITDFRGDKATFVSATRAPDGHHTGKIVFARDDYESECYMTVFDLEVRAEPEPGAGAHL
jgi:hypothetical protein